MALTPADVYSLQAPGLAQVLGSGLAPLRIIQQNEYQRQRALAAAAKAKQQEEALAGRDIVSLDANGAAPYQDELVAAQNAGYQQQLELNRQAVAGKISHSDAKIGGLQIQSKIKAQADRTNELDKQRLATVALASDPRYNKQALEQAVNNAHYETNEKGERVLIPSTRFDVNNYAQVAKNPGVYNAKEVYQRFIKDQADAEIRDIAKAAPSGGYGFHNRATSSIFEARPDGSGFVKNADGSYKIRDFDALLQRAHDDPFMSSIIQDSLSKQESGAGVAAMSDYLPLTESQRANLNALAPSKDREQVSVADMLTPYAKLNLKTATTYRAAPRPRAAGKTAGFVDTTPTQLVETNYNATTPSDPTPPTGLDAPAGNRVGYFPGKERDQTHSAAIGDFPAPLFQEKSGKKVPIKQEDFTPQEYWRTDASGKEVRVQHNNRPLAGIHGTSKGVAVDVKTGEILHPKTKEERNELIASGRADLRQAISFNTDKNEDYSADKSRILKELLAKKTNMGEAKYTPAEAELKASELAKGGVTRITHLYNDQTAAELNNKTGPAYRKYEAMLQQEQARLRAAGPRTKKDHLGFGAPTAPAAGKVKTIGKKNVFGF